MRFTGTASGKGFETGRTGVPGRLRRDCHLTSCVRVAAAATLCLALGPAWPDAHAQEPVQTKATIDAERLLADSGFHGGLVVIAGLDDAGLALRFAAQPNVLVHALVRGADSLERIRTQVREAGCYGRVSAMFWEDSFLPYAAGMVNVLLATDQALDLSAGEISRVLAPRGVAWTWRDGALASYRKPRPPGVDVWSHARYDATGNAVSKDKQVGPPRHLKWEATPRWNRGVKTSNLVTAQGRVHFILDDSHFASTERTWSLLARDAYNGILLWRYELPSWGGAQGGKKVGPAQVNRLLVAIEDRVYAALGESAPVSVMDGATGEVLRVLDETAGAEEFIVSDGVLVALVNPNTPAGIRRGQRDPVRVVAIDPATGELLWQHEAGTVLPLTLAADGGQVVFHDGQVVQSLELRTGSARWTSPPTGQRIEHWDKANPDRPGAEKSAIVLAPQFAPTMVMYRDVVAFAGGYQLNVLSAEDGTELWRAGYAPSNYSVPVDLFGFDGYLWGPAAEMDMWRPRGDDLEFSAYNLESGAIDRRLSGSYGFRFQHHRCHQMKVVDDAILAARAGIEFVDTENETVTTHHWVRGSCYYGVLPANGLLYVPPHNCACYVRAKLSGFMALDANPPARQASIPEDHRLEEGAAFGQMEHAPADVSGEDWPTYRHDIARSGRTPTKVGTELLLGWEKQLDGPLTSPVIADGRLYVASKDAHRLHALDAASGEAVWHFDADARVDSPPTIHNGLVLFGCRDGSVHALRASDGVAAWRFRASPIERLLVSRGQLESVWPVNGSVLAVNGTAYFVAGRSSYLDGGIRFYGLDAATGRTVIDTVLDTRHDDGTEFLDDQGVEGFLGGILSSNGERIFLRHHALDFEGNPTHERITHLHGPDGFLSADTTSRFVWTYAPMYTSPHQGAFYDTRLVRMLFPSGRILVEGEDVIYGFGQDHFRNQRPDPGGTSALFAAAKESGVPLDLSAVDYRKLALSGEKSVDIEWWQQLRIQAWAMVKTRDTLFVAGPLGSELTSPAALAGDAPGTLLAVSPQEGAVLADMTLPAAPEWDGMAAARGHLYVTLKNGQVLCLWPAESGRPGTPLSPSAWGAALPEAALAPEPDLLGRWRFDEGVGMLARDCSGNGHDAEVAGQWHTGETGTCLATGGAPRAAAVPDAPELRFGNRGFTLAVWVKTADRDVRILGKEAFPENWWVINLLGSGRAELVLGEGRGTGKTVRATTSQPLPKGEWVHLCAAVDRDEGEVRWYLDGAFDSRQAIPGTMTEGLDVEGRDITIPSVHKPFTGFVRDFRIYGAALAEERIDEVRREVTDQ